MISLTGCFAKSSKLQKAAGAPQEIKGKDGQRAAESGTVRPSAFAVLKLITRDAVHAVRTTSVWGQYEPYWSSPSF
jgi:hypothetical protein